VTTQLEIEAINAWLAWGAYAKWTICKGCGSSTYCRAKHANGPFKCVGCFDQERRA